MCRRASNKYLRPRNTWPEVYAGPLANHVDMSRALLRFEIKMGQIDGRTDGRLIVTLRLPLDAASVITKSSLSTYDKCSYLQAQKALEQTTRIIVLLCIMLKKIKTIKNVSINSLNLLKKR